MTPPRVAALPVFLALLTPACKDSAARRPAEIDAASLVAPAASAGAPAQNRAGLTAGEQTAPFEAAGSRCLSVISWNDLHGQIRPDPIALDTGHVPAGGIIALADEISEVSATHDAVVLLDAGDLFTGPLESTMAEGAPIVDAYRAMGVDAVAVGNHEFDFGPVGYSRVTAAPGISDEAGVDGPRGALLARMAEAPFPFLSANLRLASGAITGWKNHLAHTDFTRGGFHVGVVGYTTQETPNTTFRPNVAGLDFVTHAASNVAESIRALRSKGAFPVVLLAHASIDGKLPQLLDDPDDPGGKRLTGELASVVDGLGADLPDLIVAGHRHQWMLGRLRNVPIVSSDYHGNGLSRARFCRNDANVVTLSGVERRLAFATGGPKTGLGAKVQKALEPWIRAVKKEADEVIVDLPEACEARAQSGTVMAEQVARSIAEHATDAAGPIPRGVSLVGVVHTGALRAPLPKGPLRYGDLFTSFPFENIIGVCGTTRAGLARLLANSTKDGSARDRLPFGITGARVKMRRKQSGELEVLRVDLGDSGTSTDEAPVWVAMPDFLLAGGDGLIEGVECAPSVTSSVRVRDAWRSMLVRERGRCHGPAKNVTFTP